MFQSLAYLDSDVIDNSEKKKCKSDLKLNHTQGQLKCFFKLYHVVQDDAEKQCNQITVSLA